MIGQTERKSNCHYCGILTTESGNDLGFTGIKTAEHESCPFLWFRQELKNCWEHSNFLSIENRALKEELVSEREARLTLQEQYDSQF